ncbi:MAG TPA: hypothetical protein VFZ53_14750, partial [Polyangiaceae bacterium]
EPAPAAPGLDAPAEFAQAADALERGAYGDAVDRLELLADRGFVHPDASFNRAVAYLGRARSPQREAGDLGRAAQALSETLALRPSDAQAEALLDAVRSEIGKKRARTGGANLVARPRITRAVTGLLPEAAWGVLAALGSLSLAVGVALRFRAKEHGVPAALAMGIGAMLLVLGGGLGFAARNFRRTSKPAVVVVEEARLLDEAGRPLQGRATEGHVVPEGADVVLLERRAGLARIEWGSTDGWVVGGQVREVAGR